MIYDTRIRLRKFEKADLPQFVAWLNDPEVRAGLGMYLPISQTEEDHWFEKMVQRPPAEHAFIVEIRDGEGWRVIGSTSLFDFDWRVRKAEFGILLGDKSIWNQGYGTEVTRLMLQHGFETLNLNRIELKVFSTNSRAQRAYEKAGYVLEGIQRQANYLNGIYTDDHLMAVLREDWFARKNS